MPLAEILAVWADACSTANIKWWLHRENLLCAVGYGYFPEELAFARVAILGGELPGLLETVIPKLPNAWQLDISGFVEQRLPLRFRRNGQLLLEVDVLLDAEHPELEKVRRRSCRVHKLINLLPGRMGSAFSWLEKKVQQKGLRVLTAEAAGAEGSGDWFWDGFTDKTGDLHPGAWLKNTEFITCREGTYPVFSGYRDYLRQVYGDYEEGLFDEIGCGLTNADKEALKLHQQRCQEALAFVRQLSQEFGLRYYLLAGSVLGPVRHGGFIPWDDDIDIGIRLEELARFEELVEKYLPERLPEGFALKKPGANSAYPRMFSKICYEGRCCMDLWPLIPTWENGLRAKLLWFFAKFITKVHYKKIGYKVTRFKKLVKLVDPFLSDAFVMKLARRNERQFFNKPTDAYINLYSIYTREKETILRRWLDTEATMLFAGQEVPVVGCTEEYLTHLYGNYMAKPAPWKRASRHVERF